MSLRTKITSLIYNEVKRIDLSIPRLNSRWIVPFIDFIILNASFVGVIAFFSLIPYNSNSGMSFPVQWVIVVGINFIAFVAFKMYSPITPKSVDRDIVDFGLGAITTGIILMLLNLIFLYSIDLRVILPAVIVVYSLLSFSMLTISRILLNSHYYSSTDKRNHIIPTNIAILGIGKNSVKLAKNIISESNSRYRLIAFISEEHNYNPEILGKPVIIQKEAILEGFEKYPIDALIIPKKTVFSTQLKEIIDLCLSLEIKILNDTEIHDNKSVVPIDDLIQTIEIEDLLDRDTISLDTELISSHLQDKTILVTGGAGSIGTGIIKQISNFDPKLVVIFDQAESALFDLELELIRDFKHLRFITELGDVRNKSRLEVLFNEHNFDLVYHAAAYKHVPLIERNPREAINVNVLGTVNLAQLARTYNVGKFVLISTDKAVNPSNVMGASKRAAEIYVQSLQRESDVKTKFITTRFGNVLGSNGSVIPQFIKQISLGGPVTVTDRNVIRYFMTISEASQLVLQAGTMGKGGEIFVFDMGNPKKILDLAEKLIRLSGFIPYQDIDITITGLRPGEKLYEELLAENSKMRPTHHPKILIATAEVEEFSKVNEIINKLIYAATHKNDRTIVKLLKTIVPEYQSKNSIYKLLDVD